MINLEDLKQSIETIRPSLQMDGGDIEFVSLSSDGVVNVRLTGACHGCPMSELTLKQGVERQLKNLFPEIAAVEAVDLF